MQTTQLSGAKILVKSLERNGTRFVFGIPGAKIDAVFDALEDSPIRLIVCRHEQNAVFMAAAYGRITGEPGVVLVTSGPGVGNLTTGLLTATTEGDPVIAIGGSVASNMLLKNSHQNTDNAKIMEAVTKKSVSVPDVENLQEVITNAFRTAKAPRKGAFFISIPSDILSAKTSDTILSGHKEISYGLSAKHEIENAAALINASKLPVLFLGQDASTEKNAAAIRALIAAHRIPAVATYQGAGVLSRELFELFVGRVGLFKNQPGDRLLDLADTVITVGYDPVEYDPETWNASKTKKIVHIDAVPYQVHACYQPAAEILGDIAENVSQLSSLLSPFLAPETRQTISTLHAEIVSHAAETPSSPSEKGKIHPLQFIRSLRQATGDEDLVACDIGTVYMWMARYFMAYKPRKLLFSNGQQTLGVAMPWAIAAKLAFPEKRVFAISGDGGFLFSSMELETAVREKTPFVQFVWTDGTYNMVLEQELLKYKRKSGVDLGPVDLVSYAAAFGAKGYRLDSIADFPALFEEATRSSVPVLIDVPIDYSANRELFVSLNEPDAN